MTTTYGTTDEQGFRDMRPDEPVNFRVEVSDDNGRTYATNGLRWASQSDASAWAFGLSMRWFGCTNIRVVREADNEVVDIVL